MVFYSLIFPRRNELLRRGFLLLTFLVVCACQGSLVSAQTLDVVSRAASASEGQDLRALDAAASGGVLSNGTGRVHQPAEVKVGDATVFAIHRIYLKTLSLEQPHSPTILRDLAPPKVDVVLTTSTEHVADGFFEVGVMVAVTATSAGKTVFVVKAQQAGIFEIRNFAREQVERMLGVACTQMIYPYLRAVVSDISTRAGFPPVLLKEVNFQTMFEAQQTRRAPQGGAAVN